MVVKSLGRNKRNKLYPKIFEILTGLTGKIITIFALYPNNPVNLVNPV